MKISSIYYMISLGNFNLHIEEVFMRHLMSPMDFSVEELEKLMDLAGDIEANPAK